MDFEVYCDESRPDLFASQREGIGRFMVIGSLWIKATDRAVFKEELNAIRNRHTTFGEMKWRSVAPARQAFYLEVIDWFVAKKLDCRYRCIVVDVPQVNLLKFHEADQELGFYKFYYQLLHHWIFDFNRYEIFVDHKRNRERDRLKVLRRCLDRTNISSEVARVQALDSRDSQFIQLTDVLTGAVSARFHGMPASPARKAVIDRLEGRLNRKILPTSRDVAKFNIFKIDLGGGW
ncbi:MAG TPA: DUF3800 domain-containing protein [Pirellulales bacterium]|nr:DUF3800 domain-containing protein [Pirellulales bacterium]